MSRCYPYPPPGYMVTNKGDIKGTLIESIKLQKDKEKAKEERKKERKREKKDKKRKREEHSNQIGDGFGHGKKLNKDKTLELEKQILSLKGKYIQNLRDDESSDITEEHENPVRVAKPSYSSENSQNSNKRRRHEAAANNTIKADGSILKIRLSSFKKKEPNAIDKYDAGPSTSGRTDSIDQKVFPSGQKIVKEQPCSTSVSTGICVAGPTTIERQPSLKPEIRKASDDVAVPKPSSSKRTRAELLYKTLLESWAPPTEGSEGYYDEDGDNWLCKKKSQSCEKSEAITNATCSLDSNMWPRAQFLPSVDIYAMPYTVPF